MLQERQPLKQHAFYNFPQNTIKEFGVDWRVSFETH